MLFAQFGVEEYDAGVIEVDGGCGLVCLADSMPLLFGVVGCVGVGEDDKGSAG